MLHGLDKVDQLFTLTMAPKPDTVAQLARSASARGGTSAKNRGGSDFGLGNASLRTFGRPIWPSGRTGLPRVSQVAELRGVCDQFFYGQRSVTIEAMASIFPQWLQDLNTALGVVGFIITVVVMIQVWSIKRSFLSRARLPEILRDLERTGSALNTNLQGWPSRKNDARAQIKVAATLLSSAMPLVSGAAKAPLKQTLNKLNVAARSFGDARYDEPDAAWDIYSDIQSSIVHLTQAVRNLKWD